MGANFLLFQVPACKETKYRKKKLRALARACISDLQEITGYPPETARQRLLSALYCYWRFPKSREIILDTSGHIDFYVTGGMSWGDAPTEAAAVIEILEENDKIIECLKRWAEADAEEEVGHEYRNCATPSEFLEELIARATAILKEREARQS